MKRRSFLKGMGAVTVLVVGGGVWRAYDQGVFSVGEGPAYEPWKNWRNASENSPLALVSAAILAASPHNTQPWMFKVTNSWIELYIDTRRNVGALDPYLREATLGMGCALENLMLAASANGYAATTTLMPGKLGPIPAEPKQQLVARVDLAAGKRMESDLYAAIPHRHTNRNPYDPQKPIPTDFFDTLRKVTGDESDVKIFLFTSEEDRKKLVEISAAANTALYSDPDVKDSNERWIRTQWKSVQEFRDGLTIDAFGLPPVTTAVSKIIPSRMLRWAASRTQLNAYGDLMMTAPLMGIIAVRDRYDQEQSLRAGQIWQRTHLLATTHGLAGRPNNEAVEMVDHERILGKEARHARLLSEMSDATWQPTFVFNMGYATLPAGVSPRRSIQNVIV